MRLFALIAALLLAPAAHADLGINIYGLSWHLNIDRAHELGLDNWFNPGVGLRYRVPGERFDYFFDAGTYYDSGRSTAVFAGGAVNWRATQRTRLGLALAVFNSQSYNTGQTFIAPLPVAAWELDSVTFNVAFAPKFREFNEVNTISFWLTYWLR